MRYSYQSQHKSTAQRMRRPYMWGLVLLAMLLWAPVAGAESRALVLKEGGSTVLQFQRMHRVAVIDPTIADVMVSSLNELVVYGKQPGRTKVYVWDRHGRHEFAVAVTASQEAQQLAQKLRQLLGAQFYYRIIDSGTLLVDGQVADQGELDRVNLIVEGIAEQVEVINLVAVEGAGLSAAQRRVQAMRRLLGDKFTYVVWDDTTILMMGQAETQAEAHRVSNIVEAASDEVKISNLVTVGPAAVPLPVERIAMAIGPDYQVWALKGETVVVEGEASDEVAKQRVDNLLAAFEDDTEIINLVTLSDEPKVPLAAQRDLLQAALDDTLQVRVIEGKALAVDGTVRSEEEAEKVDKLIKLFEPNTKIINLTSIADPAKRQVLVRAKVVEINRGGGEKRGINWGQILGTDLRSMPFVVRVERGVATTAPIGAQIEALVSKDVARILSEPNLLVDDGEEASMLVGGEVPIPVPQLQAGVATIGIDYKEYGVVLKITPTILSDDRIRLRVIPEVSSIDLTTQVAIAGLNVPAFRTRKTDTTVTVDNGAPLIIAGLISRDQSEIVSKIPILGDLPIIGSLFRHKEFKEGKTELIIIVTPQIMAGGPEGIPGATEPEITGD